MPYSSRLSVHYLELANYSASKESFAGKDVRFSSEYEALESELSKGQPKHKDDQIDWQKIIENSEALLRQSKDLRVGAWLTWALYQRESFQGLLAGLSLLHYLCENHWAEIHPSKTRSRSAALSWLVSRLEQVLDENISIKDQLPLFRCLVEHLEGLDAVCTKQLGDDAPLLLPISRRLKNRVQRTADSRHASGAIEAMVVQIKPVVTQLPSSGVAIGNERVIFESPKHNSVTQELHDTAETVLDDCSQTYCRVLQDKEQERQQAMVLLDDFDTAIAKEELRVFLQPKVTLVDGRVVGAEALVRWLHPRFGLLAPNAFLPVIERAGKVCALSLWLLRKCMLLSCAQTQLQKIRISVNLSMQDLESPNFPQQVEGLLKQTGAQAAWFCMEITESCAMRNPEQCLASMLQLRQLGFTLSIDDFGTGYSSLSYLSRMPVDELKIDRSFVAQLHDSKQREIVKAIIQLGLALQLRLVAEGVENPTVCELLDSLGCHEVQGYLIAKPTPAADFFEWLNACSGYWLDIPLQNRLPTTSRQADTAAMS